MQTRFTPQQLADPDNAASERILRKCVHCGFCTATCPTYVLLGDELDSPRGRIYLIKEFLESGAAPTPEVVRHVDRCLSCLACVTTCPSGVDYRHLVDHARVTIERRHRRGAADRLTRAFIAAVLPHPRRLRAALIAARLARPVAPLLPRRLRAMVKLAPAARPTVGVSRAAEPAPPAARAGRRRVALLQGCVQGVVTPRVHAASRRLLELAGAEVIPVAGCCGALVHHMGREPEGAGFARALLERLRAEMDGAGLDAIVSDASGCGMHVKDFAWQFREDEALREVARRVAALTRDVSEVLVEFGLPPPAAPTGEVVAYHSACSMQHGQRVHLPPRSLLRAAGYDVREIPEGHLCCGSAGTYNILQPEIAARLRERKLDNVRRTGARILATGNVGCAMQLAGNEDLAVMHTVELLDRALGGAS